MEYRLEELCKIGSSKRIYLSEYTESGIPFYRGKEIIEKSNGKKISSQLFISLEKYEEIKSKFSVPKIGDILISAVGTLGKSWFVDEENFYFKDGNLIWLYDFNNEIINNRFLYYKLKSKWFENIIDGISIGSTQKAITIEQLKKVGIDVPDIKIQNKIVKILDGISIKIEVNNQINDNLSEQLQLVFDKWFGNIDIENLPEDWKLRKLKDVAVFSQGVQVPIEKQKDKIEYGYTRFIRIVDITQKNDKDIRFIEDTSRGKVTENEIFMIRYGTPGILSWNYKGIIANNLFKIIPKDDSISSNYLYSYLNTKAFQNYIKGNATSSTMPAINFSTLNDRDVILPPKDLMEQFNIISETIRIKQLNIIKQNNTLSLLRDTLLPKLMNGEIELDKIGI